MSEPYKPVPPVSGQWKPGQSGNPGGRPKKKPLTEALQRVLAKLSNDEMDILVAEHIKKLATGDVATLKEVADRVEGKVPTTLGQSDEHGPLEITWKQSLSTTSQDNNSSPTTIEHNALPASSPTEEPAKP